ncbi:MAG: helix-turn-helix transcriptional regulator [Proteobacteria bacterium]|jgi:transcriptional regulator with XRE-family HTH domain|nr:helix-turn-helix transcriptional regulator [Pseudomonadota bacterium]
MSRKNKLIETPPYAIEVTLKRLGANLRTARLRRNLTIDAVAQKIGTGPRAIANAEKGKVSAGIGIYAALLWALGLLKQLDDVADPVKDQEGLALSLHNERERARQHKDIDNDF